MNDEQLDRAAGVVVAQAAGDALGAQYEFGPGLEDSVTPEFGMGVFGHGVGEWTDDTAMAVPILQQLATGHRLEDERTLDTVVGAWQGWSRTAKDVGTQTASILSRLNPPTAANARGASLAAHRATGRTAGNGSLMRTGPVALGYLSRPERDLVAVAGDIARLTHWDDDNADACALWCLAIRHAVLTGEFDIRGQVVWLDPGRRERWAALIDEALTPGRHPRDFAEGNGWVVRAFQGALAALAGATSLQDALERAVRGGKDTDTVAAIAGALGGAVHGASAVPRTWRRILHGWPNIDDRDLARLAREAVQRS